MIKQLVFTISILSSYAHSLEFLEKNQPQLFEVKFIESKSFDKFNVISTATNITNVNITNNIITSNVIMNNNIDYYQ